MTAVVSIPCRGFSRVPGPTVHAYLNRVKRSFREYMLIVSGTLAPVKISRGMETVAIIAYLATSLQVPFRYRIIPLLHAPYSLLQFSQNGKVYTRFAGLR